MLVSIKTNERGFTIAELNVSLVVAGLIILAVSAIFINYFVLISRNNLYVEMTADSQNLLRSMVEEFRYGAGIRQSNTLSDPNGPIGGWNTNNDSFVVIIASPVKDSSGDYIIDSMTGSAYKNEYVYYKSGGDLYRRVLADTNVLGNNTVTTCPPGQSTSTCPPDVKLVDGIDSVVFQLFDQDDYSTADPLLARSINIFVALERDLFGSPIRVDNNMRITLRNTL